MSQKQIFVFYCDGYDYRMKSFDRGPEAMTFVTAIKKRQEMGENGTEIVHIIIGQEVELEPVKVTTEWRFKDAFPVPMFSPTPKEH